MNNSLDLFGDIMCGIVGCVLKNANVAPILLDSISKLEYRGYDSIGLATAYDGKINLKKDSGKIKEVDDKLHFAEMPGNFGIAHVRWATHGDPSKENAHPHLNSAGTIAVVHNGIIENYLAIKEELIAEGYEFKSDTDTEVIPHLIDQFMKEGFDLENAVRKVIGVIDGAYAIAAICVDEPNKVVATRKDSPLIVGIGENEYFVASDFPAILKYTNNIAYLEKDEIVILTENGVTFKDADGNDMKKEIDVLDWSPEMAEKEGYDHFMIKEINEQDVAIRNTLAEKNKIKAIVDEVKGTINRVVFVACGTSYHASLTGKYLIESISQSGETADTLKALDAANETSKTLAIVNVRGSSATRRADYVIQTQAGPEIGVAATKTYVSQLIAIYLFSALLADDQELLKRLDKVPDYIDEVLKKQGIIREISRLYKRDKDAFFIGRGFSYPIALEGALKLKEISYIHAEGYAAGELKHGPIALIDKNIPVVVVAPPGQDHKKIMSNLQEVKARGADILGIGAIGDEDLVSESDNVFLINPEVDDILSPLVYIVPFQLLSYHVSVIRKLDPDKPKNLAKCVTVE